MGLFNLKTLLPAFGISDLKIKFDTENQLVLATFNHGGEPFTREISFAEIETMFGQGQGADRAAGQDSQLAPQAGPESI